MLYAPQSSVYAALLGWRHLSKIGNTVAVLITPKTHEYGARRALLYCYEKIKRLYSYYAKTFKSIILSLLGCLLTMICFEIFYSLKGQTHELRMLGNRLTTFLFIMATIMDSSVLWEYFVWNVLDFFSLTFKTRQIELLSLGKITRM